MSAFARRIDSRKRVVPKSWFFEMMVRENAFYIWQAKEGMRRHQNWMDAISQLLFVSEHFSAPPMIRERAYRLWEERRDQQALEDWLEAERRIVLTFEIAG